MGATEKATINRKEPKKILKNSFYSFMSSISLYIYAIITSFLLARQISQVLWGFLIIANSYIIIVTTILSFIPPGLDVSLIYYITNYRALNKKRILKTFIIKTFFLKVGILILSFLIFIFIIIFTSELLFINLNNYYILLFILSPLIIIDSLNKFFNALNIGFNLFKLRFIINLIKYVLNIIGYLLYFIFFEVIQIEVIAIINVISALIPFIINFFILLIKSLKIEPTGEKDLSFKEIIRKILNYGTYASTQPIAGQLWIQAQIQAIASFETPQWVTAFNIGKHYSEIPAIVNNAANQPMVVSFLGLYSKGDSEKVAKIAINIVSYSLFVILLVTGILYFLTDFFLFFIYGMDYLVFSPVVKIFILSVSFGRVNSLLNMLLHITNRVKFVPISMLISYSIIISLFFTGLIFFGLYAAIVGFIIANITILIISSYYLLKILNIKLNYLKIFLQYLIFYISLGLSLLLGDLILKTINYKILETLNLLFFRHFPFLSFLTFLIIFFALNLLFKIFTKKDVEYIESMFVKQTFSHKLIRRISRILKRVVR